MFFPLEKILRLEISIIWNEEGDKKRITYCFDWVNVYDLGNIIL